MTFKNTIIYENDEVIKKVFKNELDFFVESSFYEEYGGFSFIPSLIKAENNSICIENIIGESLYNLSVEEQLKVAVTLAEFHNLTYNRETGLALMHFDTNLSNYIYRAGVVYMIDFSDVTLDSPLVDLYSILLHFCELHPPDVFKEFINSFYRVYFGVFRYSLEHDESVLLKEIERFEGRRAEYGKIIYNYEDYLVNRGVLISFFFNTGEKPEKSQRAQRYE